MPAFRWQKYAPQWSVSRANYLQMFVIKKSP
jgi:hypothetical protein